MTDDRIMAGFFSMSDDIVERLLSRAKYSREWGDELTDLAAEEIVRLRAEVVRLRSGVENAIESLQVWRDDGDPVDISWQLESLLDAAGGIQP
jgi:hypothetical protein